MGSAALRGWVFGLHLLLACVKYPCARSNPAFSVALHGSVQVTCAGDGSARRWQRERRSVNVNSGEVVLPLSRARSQVGTVRKSAWQCAPPWGSSPGTARL